MSGSTYAYRHPRPALTVDCVVFAYEAGRLQLLLIERGAAPFRGSWALPGGFVGMEESLEAAARRELAEETGVGDVYLEQIGAFGAVDRDPRDRVVTVAFYALVPLAGRVPEAATDARDARFFALDSLPDLAFDHAEIVRAALDRLRERVRLAPVLFDLLPPRFTLSALQSLYEAVIGETLDKRNFRKKVLALGFVVETKESERGVAHRAARLHRFDARRYERLRKSGVALSL